MIKNITDSSETIVIAIEGLDKSGKHSAATLIHDFFEQRGLKVAHLSLPDYNTPIGKMIRAWLKSDYHLPPKAFECLLAADKHVMAERIESLSETHDMIIIDRYVHSQMAYGAIDNDAMWVKGLLDGIELPHEVVFMDVEPEVSMHRRGKYGDNDKYESDRDRLEATREAYNKVLGVTSSGLTVIDANRPKIQVQADLTRLCHAWNIHLESLYGTTQIAEATGYESASL